MTTAANNPPPAGEVAPPAGDKTLDVTPSELVAPMGERMPPVTESAGATPAPSTDTPPPPPSAPVPELYDSRKVKFSPLRHQVDAAGQPLKNNKGNFILRADYRRGDGRTRLPGEQAERPAPQFNAPGGAAKPVDPNAPLQDEYDLAAEIYLQSAYGPVIIAFSENARPDRDDHAALKVAVANYLRAKQIKEPSPGWALLFTVVAVGVKKSADPVVRERAAALGEKLGVIAKKPEPKKEKVTQTN